MAVAEARIGGELGAQDNKVIQAAKSSRAGERSCPGRSGCGRLQAAFFRRLIGVRGTYMPS